MGTMEILRHGNLCRYSKENSILAGIFGWGRGEGEVSNYVLLGEGGGGEERKYPIHFYLIYANIPFAEEVLRF